MNVGTGVQAILRICLRNLRGCNVGITDGRVFFNYAVEISSGTVIYVPSFMKVGIGVQAILKICLRNLRGCTVGITGGKFFFIITPLRLAQVP
jgi:hypothetical protein